MRSTNLASVFVLLALTAACGSADDGGTEASNDDTTAAAGGGAGRATGAGGAAGKSDAGAAGKASGSGGSSSGSGGSSQGSGGSSPGSGGAAQGTGGAGGSTAIPANCPFSQTPGTWVDVTPPGLDLGSTEVGVVTVLADPVRRGEMYANIQFRGVFKSMDCGLTWKKMNTGTNGDKLDTGSPWGAVIDPNPSRDPATQPAIYLNQGYGALGLWKSTDGGVSWANVWTSNIYKADGTTNISSDVGSNLAAPSLLNRTDADHMVIFLHSYWGTGGNNGIFETSDGGTKWMLHPTTFNFQPHSDLLSIIDASTWIVSHSDPWPGGTIYRTTDTGASWTQSTGASSVGMGHSVAVVGGAVYMGSDAIGGLYKSTDRGASWTKLEGAGGRIGWVGATATKLYVSSGYTWDPDAKLRHASLADDATWVDDPIAGTMPQNGVNSPAITFDGTHYVIVAAQHKAGAWRYVEP